MTGEKVEPASAPGSEVDQLISSTRYRRLMLVMAFSISLVALSPLLIMTGINYHEYQEVFRSELIRPITQNTSNAKHSMEFFLSERESALEMVIHDKSYAQLSDPRQLARILSNMKNSFGGFIDLGLIDASGEQVSYAGPYPLQGKTYADQSWFHEVSLRDFHISEVFMGYRNFPHFVIAVRHENETEGSYVLRATIDTEMINRQILRLDVRPNCDAFIINRQGVLQTPSRFYGNVLEQYPLAVPAQTGQTVVEDMENTDGRPLVVGSAFIDRSPFIMMFISQADLQEGWLTLRREIAIFTSASIVLILVVVIWGSRYMVERIREADFRRATIFHNLEYTNKMAAIGRLGAGVAHEINNPLAIIDEKAGLLKDLLTLTEDAPPEEKLLDNINSILRSVERCSKITHRLLGFAKHMDVHNEQTNLEMLAKEVLGFLDKEAGYRDITVTFDVPPDLPNIESDRSQLQQVFLNIINNAFAAISDGGRVHISMDRIGNDKVTVHIVDNGAGISEEHLEHVFEPFFSTKKGAGTGLGLSITYGIVQKLGGDVSVKSKVGEGTCFSIVLPIQRD